MWTTKTKHGYPFPASDTVAETRTKKHSRGHRHSLNKKKLQFVVTSVVMKDVFLQQL